MSACKRSPTAAGSDGAASAPSSSAEARAPLPAVASAARTEGAASFDLTLAPDGAWLVRQRGGRGLEVVHLDALGAELGEPRVIVPLDERQRVLEVTAQASASTGVAAWVAETPQGTLASVVSFDGAGAEPPASLGNLDVSGTGRGRLAITTRADGRTLVMHRGATAPCRDDPTQSCTGIGFSEVSTAGIRSFGLPLNVPAACEDAIAGLAATGSRSHYAVCSRKSGSIVLTLFSIESAISYARADEVLPGCSPMGTTTLGNDVVLSADCGDARRAVILRSGNPPPQALTIDLPSCDGGRPSLTATSSEGAYWRPLEGAEQRLEALLPASVAPPLARAVWTGRALLVARVLARELTIERWQCVGGAFRRTGG